MIVNPENLYIEAEREYQKAVDFYTGLLWFDFWTCCASYILQGQYRT
jgi:Ser/Thr protein kinase RdoA (MazF antagonist)